MLFGQKPGVMVHLCEAKLIALKKSSDGIRPIAIRGIFPPLGAKVACPKMHLTCPGSVHPLQVGVGAPVPSETVVHSVEEFCP